MFGDFNLQVEAKTDDVLNALRINRAKHAGVVAEARKGYVEQAKKALIAKLDQIESGKVVSLYVNLQLPQDHRDEYDTVIKMLELHQGELIPLSATEVRQFIQDDWSWSSNFFVANAAYSGTAADTARSKGYAG